MNHILEGNINSRRRHFKPNRKRNPRIKLFPGFTLRQVITMSIIFRILMFLPSLRISQTLKSLRRTEAIIGIPILYQRLNPLMINLESLALHIWSKLLLLIISPRPLIPRQPTPFQHINHPVNTALYFP